MAGLASHQPSHLLRSAASPTGAWSCPSIICWCWCLEDKPETLGALCTERQWVASELQVLEEEDEDKNAGVKGFWFWPSPHLKGRTATNQQRVQRWLPQCHCDNWPLFSLPSDQNYPAPKRRRSNKVRPQQRHIISQKPPPADRTFSGQK